MMKGVPVSAPILRRRTRRIAPRTATASLAALLAVSASPAMAQDDGRLEALEDKIQALQEELETLKDAQGAGDGADAEVRDAVEETQWRVTDLEDVVDRIDRQVGSRAVVNAFDAVKLDMGGFIDLAAKHVNGEDESFTSFNRQVAELLVQAELADNWDMFWAQSFLRKSEPNFNNPASPSIGNLSTVNTDTVLAWGNYRYSDMLQIQAGRFITPHGIVNIEHFPATLLDPDQPQFLRPFSGQTIFPNFTNGFHIHGSTFMSSALDADQLSYNLYTGNFAGNPEEFNVGGRVQYSIGGTGATFGVNAAWGDRSRNVDSDYIVYGADFKYDAGPVIWKNEIFLTDEDVGDDRFAAYTQPGYRILNNVIAFYRLDYLDSGNDPESGFDRPDSLEHSLGVAYQPNKNVRLRTIVRQRDFDTGDEAQTVVLSATLNY
jgi:hypothetical protein